MGDLCAILPVVHQEHFEFLGVVNDKFVEAIGEDISCLLIRA